MMTPAATDERSTTMHAARHNPFTCPLCKHAPDGPELDCRHGSHATIGSRVSYEDAANPRRYATVVGTVDGVHGPDEFRMEWDDAPPSASDLRQRGWRLEPNHLLVGRTAHDELVTLAGNPSAATPRPDGSWRVLIDGRTYGGRHEGLELAAELATTIVPRHLRAETFDRLLERVELVEAARELEPAG